MLAIVNGTIIEKDGLLVGKALLLSDKIEGIVGEDEIPAGATLIDAAGGYVSPGFIDLHIHGYLGKDVCDGEVEGLRTISRGILSGGVTSYLPTTMTVEMATLRRAIEACREAMREGSSWEGAQILGVHAEGPFVSPRKKGAQNEKYLRKPDAAFVKEYADVIKIITLAPEEDTEDFTAIREIARDTDTVVSMGHTAADYERAMASVAAGVKHVTHLFNAMTPLTHRAPGVVGVALGSDVSCELIVDNHHVDKALYETVYRLKGRKLCVVSDCLSAGGLPAGKYSLGGSKIVYDGEICRLEDGTIAGSALCLNKGVWNVYQSTKIPLWECVNCASLNPACVLGVDKRKGSIEVGKDADIVILDESFEVKSVLVGGKITWQAF